jgi:undecaprenyl-diphosphatase
MTVARAVWGYIEDRDYRLMRRVHRWRAPRWFRLWMLTATRCGDGWLWYGLGVLLLVAGGPLRYEAVGAGALATATGILLFRILKRSSRRPRPCEIEPHCWSSIRPPDRYSFPSGHSITAFAVAISVGLFYPELLACLLLVAVCIAASRILLGMHFLSDVVAGSVIGALLGYSSFLLLS